ncbi:hypothetical protein H112_03128 [Trichophyton rubrum D6]|uniref:Uncharacterized protein n=2 Tax=Trichophyton TaxID=5550 RepID=A0A022W7M1_TRIRU|nr:hypothetical protein H102_03127 [Trichophyton rubrum CBS 100081]EZF54058.1 hypothetical protein H103_03141 [Trichophyton rubrum CBS 288.86]EZF64660.1 hypothetical protein H104_03123 [Trichophyton rubrum CBS 289.86]EZF75241.1 hypothetical protein H105_03146 [Trichophyton soudanense CBS 452.61]EZF96745.1 hypothetical protein H113_03143 [Trichophyton rubrum MR1459]EZG18253.1 hypothetical protein H107_03234 [Trichophyton rubrum CBS 202.88]KDB35046.1 hypothetical protein H112_03128 [Trichophyto
MIIRHLIEDLLKKILGPFILLYRVAYSTLTTREIRGECNNTRRPIAKCLNRPLHGARNTGEYRQKLLPRNRNNLNWYTAQIEHSSDHSRRPAENKERTHGPWSPSDELFDGRVELSISCWID